MYVFTHNRHETEFANSPVHVIYVANSPGRSARRDKDGLLTTRTLRGLSLVIVGEIARKSPSEPRYCYGGLFETGRIDGNVGLFQTFRPNSCSSSASRSCK